MHDKKTLESFHTNPTVCDINGPQEFIQILLFSADLKLFILNLQNDHKWACSFSYCPNKNCNFNNRT